MVTEALQGEELISVPCRLLDFSGSILGNIGIRCPIRRLVRLGVKQRIRIPWNAASEDAFSETLDHRKLLLRFIVIVRIGPGVHHCDRPLRCLHFAPGAGLDAAPGLVRLQRLPDRWSVRRDHHVHSVCGIADEQDIHRHAQTFRREFVGHPTPCVAGEGIHACRHRNRHPAFRVALLLLIESAAPGTDVPILVSRPFVQPPVKHSHRFHLHSTADRPSHDLVRRLRLKHSVKGLKVLLFRSEADIGVHHDIRLIEAPELPQPDIRVIGV